MATGNKKSQLIRLEVVGDQLKSQVDKFRNDSAVSLNEAVSKADEEAAIKMLLKKYVELTSSVEDAMQKMSNLKRDSENVKMTDFTKRKSQELDRLQNLQQQLDEIADKIDPEESDATPQGFNAEDSLDEDDDEYSEKHYQPGKMKQTPGSDYESEEDDDEYEDEEEEVEEEEDDNTEGPDNIPRHVEAICDFGGEEPGDLQFNAGEILTVISTREDGWWEAENNTGDRGLVPTTYLKAFNEEQKEGSFQDQEENRQSPSGRELWAKVREAASQSQEGNVVNQALSAMGAMPSCFRQATLGKLAIKGGPNSIDAFLLPKLSPSNLSYQDLLWNEKDKTIAPYHSKVTRLFHLVTAKNVPSPGAGVEILSRHVRIALSNRAKILSNVHTVRAVCLKDNQMNWKFSPVVKGALPSIFDGNSVARIDFLDSSLGLLFELCYTYERSATTEKAEVSCGWCFLPLFTTNGAPAANKTYELKLQGGTIYEPGIEIDDISQKSGKRRQNPFSARKQPRLLIRLANPKRSDMEIYDYLPDTIITCQSYAPFVKYYREILGKIILYDSPDEQSTDLIHNPVLAAFSEVMQHSDLMDALKTCWEEKIKSVKRVERRNREFMLNFFVKIFMQSAYPLLYSAELKPAAQLADNDVYQARYAVIEKFLKQSNVLSNLLSSTSLHTPFDTSEMSFDIAGNVAQPDK